MAAQLRFRYQFQRETQMRLMRGEDVPVAPPVRKRRRVTPQQRFEMKTEQRRTARLSCDVLLQDDAYVENHLLSTPCCTALCFELFVGDAVRIVDLRRSMHSIPTRVDRRDFLFRWMLQHAGKPHPTNPKITTLMVFFEHHNLL